jgi:hypothetical protein
MQLVNRPAAMYCRQQQCIGHRSQLLLQALALEMQHLLLLLLLLLLLAGGLYQQQLHGVHCFR